MNDDKRHYSKTRVVKTNVSHVHSHSTRRSGGIFYVLCFDPVPSVFVAPLLCYNLMMMFSNSSDLLQLLSIKPNIMSAITCVASSPSLVHIQMINSNTPLANEAFFDHWSFTPLMSWTDDGGDGDGEGVKACICHLDKLSSQTWYRSHFI